VKRYSDLLVKFGGPLIFVIAAVLYLPTIDFGYVLDDQIVISENKFVKKGVEGILDIMTTEGFVGYFGEERQLVAGSRYRPLSLVTFAIEEQILPGKPWLGHLTNLILYGFLGWLIFVFGTRLLPHIPRATALFPFIMALLYVLHPVHVEAVANIKGRDEVLATLCFVGALTLTFQKSWNTVLRLVLLFILALAAMLAKEYGLTLIAVLPLLMWMVQKSARKEIILHTVPLLLAAGVYSVLRINALGTFFPGTDTVIGDLMNNPFLQMTGSQKWATIFAILGRYLGLMFFPHPLTHDYYPYHIRISEWAHGGAIASIMIYAGLLFVALRSFKKDPWVLWSALLFGITLLPVSNILFPVGTFMNERFLFLPSLGFIIVISAFIDRWRSSKRSILRLLTWGVLIIMILGFAVRTLTRIPDWKSGRTLNESAIKVSSNSARINLFVGTDYYNDALVATSKGDKRKLLERSKKHLEKAVRIYPLYGSANNMLSGVCAEMFKEDRDVKRLLSCFEEVAANRPDTDYLLQFLDYLQEIGGFENDLFKFYMQTGYNRLFAEKQNFPHALRYLRRAVDIKQGDRALYQKLSEVYMNFGIHLQEHPDPNFKTSDIIESGRYFGRMAQGL
jgi:hypothetical protein